MLLQADVISGLGEKYLLTGTLMNGCGYSYLQMQTRKNHMQLRFKLLTVTGKEKRELYGRLVAADTGV